MAEVTVNSIGQPNVIGNQRQLYFNCDIVSGRTLTTKLKKILMVTTDQPGNITVQAEAGGVITFTGNATAANVSVTGH